MEAVSRQWYYIVLPASNNIPMNQQELVNGKDVDPKSGQPLNVMKHWMGEIIWSS